MISKLGVTGSEDKRLSATVTAMIRGSCQGQVQNTRASPGFVVKSPQEMTDAGTPQAGVSQSSGSPALITGGKNNPVPIFISPLMLWQEGPASSKACSSGQHGEGHSPSLLF